MYVIDKNARKRRLRKKVLRQRGVNFFFWAAVCRYCTLP